MALMERKEVSFTKGNYGEEGYKKISRTLEQITNGYLVTERVETWSKKNKKKGDDCIDCGKWSEDTSKTYYEEEPDLMDEMTFTGSSLVDDFK